MIGHNTLELNGATMQEAIQEYLDKRMGTYSPKVVNVTASNSVGCYTFRVDVADRDTDKADDKWGGLR